MFTRVSDYRMAMNRYTFVLPSENQNASARYPSAQMPTVTQELKPLDISYSQNILQRSTRNFEICRRVPRVKKNLMKLKKNTNISLSLIRRCIVYFDFPERMCMHQYLSDSLSLTFAKTVRIQIRPEWYPGKNVSST